MDQSKALLSALLTTHVIDFIDFRKLAFSSVMRDLTTQAALHAIQHGDSSYIDKILDIFKTPGMPCKWRVGSASGPDWTFRRHWGNAPIAVQVCRPTPRCSSMIFLTPSLLGRPK